MSFSPVEQMLIELFEFPDLLGFRYVFFEPNDLQFSSHLAAIKLNLREYFRATRSVNYSVPCRKVPGLTWK